MVNAKLHIICGNCGNGDDFQWEIDLSGNCNGEGKEFPDVFVRCENCLTVNSLTSEIGDGSCDLPRNGQPEKNDGR
jgi:hypothetical protein